MAENTKLSERAQQQRTVVEQPVNQGEIAVPDREKRAATLLRDEIERMGDQFAAALPPQIPAARFARVIMTAVQQTPALLFADRRSFWNAAMRAAHDGCLPDGREGAFVIYRTKRKVKDPATGRDVEEWFEQVQWQIMIAGLRKKARNSGEIADWNVRAVYEKDTFRYQLGDEEFIEHVPFVDDDPGPLVFAYSICRFKDGGVSREVMSRRQIDRIRAMSKAPDGPGWKGHYDEMAKKTVARRHSKVLPMSTDLDDLIRRDDEVNGFDDAPKGLAPPRPTRADFLPKQTQGRLESPEGRSAGPVHEPRQESDTGKAAEGEDPAKAEQAVERLFETIMGEISTAKEITELEDIAQSRENDLLKIGETSPKNEADARQWLAQRIQQLDPGDGPTPPVKADTAPATADESAENRMSAVRDADPQWDLKVRAYDAGKEHFDAGRGLLSAPDEFRVDLAALGRFKAGWNDREKEAKEKGLK